MTEDRVKRELIVIFNADVIGYSQLMEATACKSIFLGGMYVHDPSSLKATP